MWDWTYSLRKEICSCDYKDRGNLQTCPGLPPRQKLVHRAKGRKRNWVPLVQRNEHTSWHPDKDDSWTDKDISNHYLTYSKNTQEGCGPCIYFDLVIPTVTLLMDGGWAHTPSSDNALFSSRYVSSIRYPATRWSGMGGDDLIMGL